MPHLEKDDEIRQWTVKFLASVQALAVLLPRKADLLEKQALLKYARFELGEPGHGSYTDLADALDMLGEKYLLPEIKSHLEATLPYADPPIRRIVEFGPGTGWLIRAIQYTYPYIDYHAVDRRVLWRQPQGLGEVPTIGTDHYHQIDLGRDIPACVEAIPPGADLLVLANNFIHCIDIVDLSVLVEAYSSSHWVVVEPDTPSRGESPELPYLTRQLKLFGATPLNWKDIYEFYNSKKLISAQITPSIIGQRVVTFKPTSSISGQV